MAKPSPPEHTRFKPGQSGNPSGRPKLPPALKAIKELSTSEVKRVIAKYARMSRVQLQDAIKDPNTPIYEITIAAILATSAKNGDFARLAFILDRTIGKPKNEDDGDVNDNDEQLSDTELQLIRQEARARST